MPDRTPEELLNESWHLRRYGREWVASYPSIKRMALSIVGSTPRGSPATVNNYVQGIRKFTKHLAFEDPESALREIKAGNVDVADALNRQHSGFIDVMLESDYSKETVNIYVHGIRKWLEANDVKFDWGKVKKFRLYETREWDRAPTKEEIRRLLNHAPKLKDRVALLTMSSSGLSVGTLLCSWRARERRLRRTHRSSSPTGSAADT